MGGSNVEHLLHMGTTCPTAAGGGRGSKAWGGADPITPPSALPIDKGGGMSLRRSPRLGGGALGDCRTKKPQKVEGGGAKFQTPPKNKREGPKRGGAPKTPKGGGPKLL